jgi:Family of unknown function (DUF6390)
VTQPAKAGPPAAPAAAGARLFARYAFAPNELGYCGPADAGALFGLAATGTAAADIAGIARRFSGAWPYLRVLAELAGISDPLDERVVRAYWTGGPLLHQADPVTFGTRLLAVIGPQAGHYWAHLTDELLAEASPTHAFHVLGVYPWSRLLTAGQPEHPLRVLDMCRIRWGRVLASHPGHVTVSSRHLTWDGSRLGLSAPTRQQVRTAIGGASFVPGARPGDWLALHWDWACERLSPASLAALRRQTRWQLAATNTRLAAALRASR